MSLTTQNKCFFRTNIALDLYTDKKENLIFLTYEEIPKV